MNKELIEKRNDYQDKMENIVNTAKAEKRALNEDEINSFNEMKKEISNIDNTLKIEEDVLKMENKVVIQDNELTQEQKDIKNFAGFIRNSAKGILNTGELTTGDNGAVIPVTIVNKIMDKVSEISPIYAQATKYNIGGTLNIPVYGANAGDDITVAYATEFDELTSHNGKFTSIQLTGFLVGALSVISKSLINNSDFDLVNFVINKMAEKVAKFVERELLYGTSNKISGVIGSYDSANMAVTLAKKSTITADELIDIQDKVIDAFQNGCIWIMNRSTRKAIRKLKDANGEYLLQKDITSPFGYTILGKPVYCSDNVTALGTASTGVIFYGDFNGLAVKETEKSSIQVLIEKYATQHAIGVVTYLEMDAKVENTQKIAVAVTGATD